MQLVLSEDQTMLAQTARQFTAKDSPVERLRRLRDADDELAYEPDVWHKMAELGWTGIPFSEADGGLGLGLAETVLVTEAMGRTLMPEPYLSCVMLAGGALAKAGNEDQKASHLAPLIEGERILAWAHYEHGARHDRTHVDARLEPAEGGFRLRGEKQQVLGGNGADGYVVVARSKGATADREGLSLCLVPASAAGVRVTRQRLIDSRNAALVRFENVTVPAENILGEIGAAAPVVHDVLDRATVALCGEMLGGMSEALERTLEYLKERKQFGVPIGSFQALKHRAARLFIDVELCQSLVMAAARALDEGDDSAPALLSAAKARCSDAYVHLTHEAVQLHGGIGMTDEHDIGLFLKHAKVCEMTLGDAAFHRDRFATQHGF